MTSYLYSNPNIFSMIPSSSAAGTIAYLMENDDQLKVAALKKIYSIIDLHWAEVCDSLPVIEELSEDSNFSGAQLAAAVASKCFYHLQEYNDSLRLALCAGSYFNIFEKSEYVETLLSKCIDEYTVLKLKRDHDPTADPIDPRMENIVEQMFQRCYRDDCFEQAMGVAIDTRRLDKIEEVCTLALAANKENILGYTFNLCQGGRTITSRDFRLHVIAMLVRFYESLADPDYTNMCLGLQYLNQPEKVALTLDKLCRSSDNSALQAYQIAFDLQEAENQGFNLQVVSSFPALNLPPPAPTAEMEEKKESGMDVVGDDSSSSSHYEEHIQKIRRILVEGFDVDLVLNFLFKQSRADSVILHVLKAATEGRVSISVLHNATVISHAYMNSGTTVDTFLRMNLDWLSKSSNWSKFTAVASIGVVHKGHVHESMNLLAPYLPRQGISASPFSESGALYALGLIHANKGGRGDSATITYLSNALLNAGNNEVVQHGACLGIGLAAMATGNEMIFEQLKGTLFTDSAVAGEGAALGIGLLLLGQSDSKLASEVIPDLLNYVHDTLHEKIIRSLSLSIAMMVYGKEESADVLIEQLARDRDPIVRYGAMYAVAMAYCGTSDNSAIKRLLHVAVSDVNDDVRRAAVTCLGFVLCRRSESVPKLVSLLAESFNPHVRYGACMAVGIACVGTANKDAIDLLQPMLDDQVDFVRQGAYMSMALVLMQISEARSPTVKKFRDQLSSVIADKHQTLLAKSGAAIAFGILDAGGRNVVVSMVSRAGFMKMASVVGVALWLQYWYWYPLMHFLSLSFTPTMLIGLNKDFDIPVNFTVKCAAPPSMFAYFKVEEKREDKKEKVVTAVLSTTVKTKAREARKEAKKFGRQASKDHLTMPPMTGLPSPSVSASLPDATGLPLERVHSHFSTTSYLSVEEREPVITEEPKKKEREPGFFMLANPDRLIPTQTRYISVVEGQRYVPVDKRLVRPTGIVVLADMDPTVPEEVSKVERVALGQEEEAAPPQPFTWRPEDDI